MDIPFLGREKELEAGFITLKSNKRKDHAIFIDGAVGSGKTTLLYKLADKAEKEDYLVCTGVNSEAYEPLSLQIWMDILEKCRLGFNKKSDGVITAPPIEKNLFSALYGSWDTLETLKSVAPENRKHLLFSWIGSYLAEISSNFKLCLAIDNIHLCGDSSIDLLLYLYSLLENCQVVFILSSCTEREIESPGFRELENLIRIKSHNTFLSLKNLSLDEIKNTFETTRGLVEKILSPDDLFKITMGNPLALSVLLRSGNAKLNRESPMDTLWSRYKRELSKPVIQFLEGLSLLGNYISSETIHGIAELSSDIDFGILKKEVLRSSILITRDEGYAFYHNELRRSIVRSIPETLRKEKIKQNISTLEKISGNNRDDERIRLAELYILLNDQDLDDQMITGITEAFRIMENRNAWDKSLRYLEKLVSMEKIKRDPLKLNTLETKLLYSYVESGNIEKFSLLLPSLSERLFQEQDHENMKLLLKLNPFVWNFFPQIFMDAIDRLMAISEQKDPLLIIQRATLITLNPFQIESVIKEVLAYEYVMLHERPQEEQYFFYCSLGFLRSAIREFDKAASAFLKADMLKVGKYRYIHLYGLAKLMLFSDYENDEFPIVTRIENLHSITRNQFVKLSYVGMLQRQALYKGDFKSVLSYGKDSQSVPYDYLTIPRFLARIWTGKKESVRKYSDFLAAHLSKRLSDKTILPDVTGMIWMLALWIQFYGDLDYLEITNDCIDNLLDNDDLNFGFRIHLLISGARICCFAYGNEKSRYFLDELIKSSDFFLEEEIHSIEIAKGLLLENLGNIEQAQLQYKSGLNWCESVGEKPWRTWILFKLSELYKNEDINKSTKYKKSASLFAKELKMDYFISAISSKSRSERKYDLTRREIEVMELLTKGYSDKEIGSYLFISEHTVANHLRKIYKKIHASNRVEASRIATMEKLVTLED